MNLTSFAVARDPQTPSSPYKHGGEILHVSLSLVSKLKNRKRGFVFLHLEVWTKNFAINIILFKIKSVLMSFIVTPNTRFSLVRGVSSWILVESQSCKSSQKASQYIQWKNRWSVVSISVSQKLQLLWSTPNLFLSSSLDG